MKENCFTATLIKLPLFVACNKIGVVIFNSFRGETAYP
ncbi:hypothetical protein PEC301296_02740 [Pectobacterium carotovorum subsp. carotovorum]|nr:hypothetical protein PEC301296_02740 [Pectobacterium carotovorum subsp. carotovorum]